MPMRRALLLFLRQNCINEPISAGVLLRPIKSMPLSFSYSNAVQLCSHSAILSDDILCAKRSSYSKSLAVNRSFAFPCLFLIPNSERVSAFRPSTDHWLTPSLRCRRRKRLDNPNASAGLYHGPLEFSFRASRAEAGCRIRLPVGHFHYGRSGMTGPRSRNASRRAWQCLTSTSLVCCKKWMG